MREEYLAEGAITKPKKAEEICPQCGYAQGSEECTKIWKEEIEKRKVPAWAFRRKFR